MKHIILKILSLTYESLLLYIKLVIIIMTIKPEPFTDAEILGGEYLYCFVLGLEHRHTIKLI